MRESFSILYKLIIPHSGSTFRLYPCSALFDSNHMSKLPDWKEAEDMGSGTAYPSRESGGDSVAKWFNPLSAGFLRNYNFCSLVPQLVSPQYERNGSIEFVAEPIYKQRVVENICKGSRFQGIFSSRPRVRLCSVIWDPCSPRNP